MIKVIIFDIGGVLIDSERSFDAICEDFARAIGAPPEKVIALHARYLNRMFFGKVSARQFFSAIKKEFHVKGDLEKIWVRVAKKRVTPNKELLGIIDALRKQYVIAVLSNVSEIRSLIDEQFDLYSHFDQAFLSYKLKMKKPSKRIFQYALKKLGVTAGEALFIDDKEANLHAARELGIKSLQFNNNAQLVTELTRLGLV